MPKSNPTPSSGLLHGLPEGDRIKPPLVEVAERELIFYLTDCYFKGRRPPMFPASVSLEFLDRFHLHPHEERVVVSDSLTTLSEAPYLSRSEKYTLLEYANTRWNNTKIHLDLALYAVWLARYCGWIGKIRLLMDLIRRPKPPKL